MAQSYKISCPHCGHIMQVTEQHLGQTGRCPKCKEQFRVALGEMETVPDSSFLRTSTSQESNLRKPDEPQTDSDPVKPVEWKVGNVYLNLYAVTNVLGEGGMGKVFKVRHTGWDIDLAVKCPRSDMLKDSRTLDAFERECETWVNLSLHPYIVSCYYVRRLGGLPRIFAEYVDGGSLRNWIVKGRLYEGGKEKALERILTIAIQIAWGLQHAHENGLIHRDVKASNILMTRTGSAKVTDFGLASARLKVEGMVGGVGADALVSAGGMTPAYCSPEQARREQVTKATDLWSWGLCLLEMMCGGVTWKQGPDAPASLRDLVVNGATHDFVPDCPRDLASVIACCCAEEPSDRPESAEDAAEAVMRVYEEIFAKPFPQKRPRGVEVRAENLNNRAVSFIDLGKLKDAEGAWSEALKADPKHTETTYNLGLYRWRTGRITDEQLVQYMREVVQMHPEDIQPLSLLTQVHLERGDCESAMACLRGMEKLKGAHILGPLLLKQLQDRQQTGRFLVRDLRGHADKVNCATMNRAGTEVLSGSHDNTLLLWQAASGEAVKTLAGHTSSVERAILNREGDRALSCGRDRTVRYWDVTGEKCLKVMETPDALMAMGATPDLTLAMSGGVDGTLTCWIPEDGEKRFQKENAHNGGITSIALSRDGIAAVSAGRDGVIHAWNMEEEETSATLTGHQGAVTAVALSDRGRFVLSGGEDNAIRLWDLESKQCVREFRGHTDDVTAVSFARDGRHAVSSAKDGTVRLWNLTNGCCIRTYRGHDGDVRDCEISRNMRYITSAGADKTVKVWDSGSKMTPFSAPLALCQAMKSETALSTEIAFAKALDQARQNLEKGNFVGAASYLRAARSQPGFRRNSAAMNVWGQLYLKLPRRELAGTWEGPAMKEHIAAIRSIDISFDGSYAVTGSDDKNVKIWDLAHGRCFMTLEGHTAPVNVVAFSEDAKFVVSVGGDNTIRYWSVETGECVQLIDEVAGSIESLHLGPNDDYAVTGGWTIAVWDVASGRCIRTFGAHTAAVFGVAWTPDGRYVLAGTSEEEVKLWDVVSEDCMQVFSEHKGVVRAVKVSADGRFVYSVSNPVWGASGHVLMWELDSGEVLKEFSGHAGNINSLDISMDGRHLITGGGDNTVRLWEIESGECVQVLTEHLPNVQSVRFSPDGRYLAAAGEDGVLQTWVLDWALADRAPGDVVPEATPYLDTFLYVHRPYAARLDPDTRLDDGAITKALTRKGKPEYDEAAFQMLMHKLGCAGMGWISPDAVRDELGRRSQKSMLSWIGTRFGSRKG